MKVRIEFVNAYVELELDRSHVDDLERAFRKGFITKINGNLYNMSLAQTMVVDND